MITIESPMTHKHVNYLIKHDVEIIQAGISTIKINVKKQVNSFLKFNRKMLFNGFYDFKLLEAEIILKLTQLLTISFQITA